MDARNLPRDKEIAGEIIKGHNQHTQTALEMGILGKWFGVSSNVSLYVAALVAVSSAFCFIILMVDAKSQNVLNFKESKEGLLTLFTLSSGFLFGKSFR